MAAAATDKFTEVGSPGTATTLAAPGHTIGGNTLNVISTANWPTATGVVFAMDQIQTVNGVTSRVAGTYRECVGVVTSSTSIGSVSFLVGSDANYPAGTTTRVYIPVASSRENRLVQALVQSLNQDGSLKTAAVQTALNLGSSALNGWNPLAYTFAYGANNSAKEYTITTANDLSAVLSPGMRMQLTRGTTAPTQCMSFVSASSQYGLKTSPSGLSFTTAFTTEAWVYLNSYGGGADSGNEQFVVGRDNGSFNGWSMKISRNGQILIATYSSAGAYREQASIQSIPLKRWVHLAANWTSSTFNTYLNGVSLANYQFGGSGTPALTQPSTPLSVGALHNGTVASQFFDGYIAEVRVWSAVQTQANILANMNITLVGNETNLVALFKGNGVFTDSTANANTLTASGGALATQAANPYNNIEYGIITKVSYSNPTTTITLFTGTDYNVPNMTLSNVQYATASTPFGWPRGRDKWIIDTRVRRDLVAAPGAGTWTNFGGVALSAPTGPWELGYSVNGDVEGSNGDGNYSLSTSNSTETVSDYGVRVFVGGGNRFLGQVGKSMPQNMASLTPWYLLGRPANASNIHVRGAANGSGESSSVVGYCAYA